MYAELRMLGELDSRSRFGVVVSEIDQKGGETKVGDGMADSGEDFPWFIPPIEKKKENNWVFELLLRQL